MTRVTRISGTLDAYAGATRATRATARLARPAAVDRRRASWPSRSWPALGCSAAADDTVAVWAVAADLGAGRRRDRRRPGGRSRVRFATPPTWTATSASTTGCRPTSGSARGRGRRAAAAGRRRRGRRASDTVQLPIAVDAEQVPPAVDAGSVVDVYLVRDRRRGDRVRPATALVLAGSPWSTRRRSTRPSRPPARASWCWPSPQDDADRVLRGCSRRSTTPVGHRGRRG